MKQEQKRHINAEIRRLQKVDSILTLKCYEVFENEEGLLGLRGRLQEALITFDKKTSDCATPSQRQYKTYSATHSS